VIPRSRLHNLVDAFPGRRVLVYGDAVLDRFILGTPKRISREAPVIILRHEGERDVPGGGANAMANVAALGGAVLPVAVVGDDERGAALRTALEAAGVSGGGLLTAAGLRTVTKVRLLGGGATSLKHQVARYDIEDELGEDAPCRAALLARLEEAATSCDAAVVSDYGYGVVDPDGVRRLRASLRPGVGLVADSRFALTRLAGVHGATPNLEELQAAAGAPISEDGEVAVAAETLRRRLEASFLVATRGSRGLTLVEEGRAPVHLPVYGTDQVADVTGAGDTVIATLTLALAAGASPVEAAILADLAAGVVVTKLGTATVSPAELHRAVDLARFLHA
jgi:rfaE bifunctional protein kinase chain/domain